MNDFAQEVESLPKIVSIGTKNIVAYLEGAKKTSEGDIRGDIDDFEKVIEMPEEVHHAIKEMYDSRHEEAVGMGEFSNAREMTYVNRVDELLPGIKGDVKTPEGQETVQVEQSRIVFTDTHDGSLRSTGIEYGFGREVDINKPFEEVRSEKGYPLIVMHTHPEDANFSVPDYWPLLVGIRQEQLRLVGSIMVLCPDMQILAVATKDTPILDDKEVRKLVDSRVQDIDDKHVSLTSKLIDYLKQVSDRKLLVETIEGFRNTLGESHPEAFDATLKMHKIQDGESQMLTEAVENAKQFVSNELPRGVNAELISFAREMGVKMYFSKDMRTFKEFSA